MDFPPAPPSEDVDWSSPPPTPAEIRDSLRTQPKPTTRQSYRLAEAEFWRHRHVPVGSVILFSAGFVVESAQGNCAVLVKERESLPDGIWLKVRCLGTDNKDFYKDFLAFFKKGKVYIHLCQGETAACPRRAGEGCHLDEFEWFPPGDFDAKWISASARKAVRDGPKMAAEELASDAAAPSRSAFTTLEDRLERLKGQRHVTFAGAPAPGGGQRDAVDLETSRAGTGLGRGGPSSALPALRDAVRVKPEPIPVESDSEAKRHKKKKHPRDMEDRLAQAVTDRRRKEIKAEKNRSRSRSRRSRRRSKRKRHKRSDSRSPSDDQSRDSSSSSDSLIPPLKKRSQKEPGSVFRLLETQAMEQLAREGVMEDEHLVELESGRRPKIFTFFQLALKPTLDPRSRDCREISLLARCLDMLREGRLASLADVLAARLLAVETATRQGWATARHLEVYGPEEEGPVPPHILLSAQKHQRQVEKAGGKGSWPRAGQWSWSEWQTDARPKGRGKGEKGKGKKGKGKPKGKGGEAKGETEPKTKGPDG